jgi:hypothetical protein
MSAHKHISTSEHFKKALDASELQLVVLESIALLSPIEFDTIAFIGLSGAVVAPIIAYEMGKELLMIRKSGGADKSNSGQWIEGNVGAKRVVIVDDLISSGKTISQVMHALRQVQLLDSPDIKIVGVLLHCQFIDGIGGGDNRLGPKFYTLELGSHMRARLQSKEACWHHPVTDDDRDYSTRPSLFEESTEVPLTHFDITL